MNRNRQTQAIGMALSAYFVSQGMTQAQVAAKYNISQSWVGRIYQGEFSERAKAVSKMCETAGIPFLKNGNAEIERDATKHRLLRLLASVWEGTEEDANNLTAALLAIKKLRAPSSGPRE